MATISLPRGVAKTWVRFVGSGTVAIDDDENVDSITDEGTGQYTVIFTQDFAAADYCWTGGVRDSGAAVLLMGDLPVAPVAGSHRVRTLLRSNGTFLDAEGVSLSYLGDLA